MAYIPRAVILGTKYFFCWVVPFIETKQRYKCHKCSIPYTWSSLFQDKKIATNQLKTISCFTLLSSAWSWK